MLNAKYKFLTTDRSLDKSIKCFEQTLSLNRRVQTFNAIPYFDLIWCSALKCDWNQAIKYSQLLSKQATHSPTNFVYFEAVFQYIKGIEMKDKKCRQEANRLFKYSLEYLASLPNPNCLITQIHTTTADPLLGDEIGLRSDCHRKCEEIF